MEIVKKKYETDVYQGYGCSVEKTPSGFDATDPFPGSAYETEQSHLTHCGSFKDQMAFDPALKSEIALLMRHFCSSRFMSQFVYCDDENCPLEQCGRRGKFQRTVVDRFFAKFGGRFPTPVPRFTDHSCGDYPFAQCEVGKGQNPSDVPELDDPGQNLRYLNFADLLRSDLPQGAFGQDRYYSGGTKGQFCSRCPHPVFIRSDAAWKRHEFLAHEGYGRTRKRRLD